MNLSPAVRDGIERLFWTFVAAFGGGLLGPALIPSIDLPALDAALLSGVTAVVSLLTSVAFPPPEVGTVLATIEHTEG